MVVEPASADGLKPVAADALDVRMLSHAPQS
jgi:hypothetical protein